jgi:membrane-bound lytic murein transglycosylase B
MAAAHGPVHTPRVAIVCRLIVGFAATVLLLAGLPEPAWSAAPSAPSQRPLRPEIESFIDEMALKHAFDRPSLRRIFRQAQPRPAVIRAISTPGTARPWHEFRRLYIEEKRIAGGIGFWHQNAATLARARREFGVPEEIVVATIGVETFYGRNIGRFKVLEALSMLAFDYPPRAPLFRAELEEFLLLTRETGFDALEARGSYAGAMGIPQFLPSSYRKYAIDFDGDGHPDLWGSPADAIGSVANYYRTFGWQAGAPIAVEAQVAGEEVENTIAAGIKPHASIADMRRRGIAPLMPVDEEATAALVRIDAESGPQHWLGLQNFYVITRYNRSVNYAMVVYELARELRSRMGDAPLDPLGQ